MLPSVTDELAVSAMQFDAFVSRHRSADLPMYVEDNTDMSESYIMIDRMGASFRTLRPVVATTTARQSWISAQPQPFSHIQLSPARYLQRYTLAGFRMKYSAAKEINALVQNLSRTAGPTGVAVGMGDYRRHRAIQPHDWLYAERSARIPEFQT
jgi:hypothetical protein